MKMFAFAVYQDEWKPIIGEKLVPKRELDNPMDKHAVKVVREFSQIPWYFFAHSGKISVGVITRRQHCKQLCEWRFHAS